MTCCVLDASYRLTRSESSKRALPWQLLHYGATIYESLPDPVPTHWGPGGSPDDWSPKSFGSVFFAPLVGAGVCIFLALVTAAHRTAHYQGIRPTEAEEQENKLRVAGILYNTPDNAHVLVPKRAGTGVGWTVNVGSHKGSLVVGVFLGGFVVLPIVPGVIASL